ncbi:pyridoxal-dependent decarboxylase [Ligilactobacillus saerimneri]|uniref:pyridoxal-dependent decarboxylase n=1 Tax=Ligilactobacillus saerimneri TaxID=228229 RepID=UPI0024B1B5F7|nr:pyridoxal-dependent decarboxylase [Ligilactobacillus saerimneri]MDI9206567.1 pyridoxal-dependent decarboxylase [Ligilactobacillus saerimneri]
MSIKKDYKDMDLSAYFLGPKGENVELFKQLTNELIDDHVGYRKNFGKADANSISEAEKITPEYNKAVANLKEVMHELSAKLRDGSIPWATAGRYWGHMDNETLLPAILAFNFAILWNGNGVAWAGSPASTLMEKEVGLDLAKLCGYDENGWGYVATDGTIANVSALWMARNVASIPLAVKEVCPELVAGKSEWELLNMSVKESLDLLDKSGDKKNDVKSQSARSGKNLQKLGKWLVPSTMHYSWKKAVDITGVGEDNLIVLPVDEHYQIDLEKLDAIIRENVDNGTPILGVVAVVGSTEEGAVDRVDQIVKMREKYRKEGVDFIIHVDSAYGGYGRAVYIDEDGQFIPYDKLEGTFKKYGIFTENNQFMKKNVYEAYKAMGEADSITIDPHKMGYVPYDAGGLTIKDTRMKDSLTYYAPYAFQEGVAVPASIGQYTLEGSKAAGSAAAVWAAHRVLPLNISGYGRLVARTLFAARRFHDMVDSMKFEINGKTIKTHAVYDPDFNMVDWVFKEEGNNSLKDMNDLTQAIAEYTSTSKGGDLYSLDVLITDSQFNPETYGDAPVEFIKSLGINGEEYHTEGKLEILRSSCMTPWVYDEESFNYWEPRIKEAIQGKLEEIANSEDIL